MPELTESEGRLEIASPMRAGMRVFLTLVGLVPLLAPYQMLVQVEWRSYANVPFAFALLVSLGATAVSFLFLAAALAGVSSRLVLDRARAEIVHTAWAPLVKKRVSVHAFSDVTAVRIETHEWSDGPPSYTLKIDTADGKPIETGSTESRSEMEAAKARVDAFLARRG
jgi:hypothetical protein